MSTLINPASTPFQRDKLEFELSVIVDEIGLVHHAMED